MRLYNKLISYKHIFTVISVYLFLSFAGCFMVLIRMVFTGKLMGAFLIWNLFLTWIPLIFSLILNYVYNVFPRGLLRSALLSTTGLVWIAFYPNAPYIITDFIHLNGTSFYLAHQGYHVAFLVWYDFVMISLFILTGFLLGFVSLYLIQSLFIERHRRFLGWLFASGMLFVSSFGIYLGRFIRWNSWDIVIHPFHLFKSVLASFHPYALAFTFTFGLFLILIYFALYYLTHLNEHKPFHKSHT